MPLNKVMGSFDEAVADVHDGAMILVGHWGGIYGPSYLLRALAKQGAKDLTIVGNGPFMGRDIAEFAAGQLGLPKWFEDASVLLGKKQVKKAIVSVPAAGVPIDFPLEKALHEGQEIDIELIAQGTLAERCRQARAGIPAFYVPTGAGTYLQRGKEVRVFDGQECLLEYAFKADFAFIWAYKADRYGNLVFRGTSRSFNATMAGAAKVTIAEVDELVNLVDLDPEAIVVPSIYVDRVVVRPRT